MNRVPVILLAGNAILLSACRNHADNQPEQQATAAHILPVQMSVIAADNCHSAGGSLAYSRQLDGTRIGMCQLVNGKRCSEAALINGSCAR